MGKFSEKKQIIFEHLSKKIKYSFNTCGFREQNLRRNFSQHFFNEILLRFRIFRYIHFHKKKRNFTKEFAYHWNTEENSFSGDLIPQDFDRPVVHYIFDPVIHWFSGLVVR